MKTYLKTGSGILLLLTLIFAVFCFASCEKDGEHVHSFKETVVPPSCTDGYTLHVCTVCGYSYTDQYTEGIGHSFTDEKVDAACNANQTIKHTCTVCGYSYSDETDERGTIHDLQKQSIVAPTHSEGGYTIYRCTGCGLTEHRDPTDPVDFSVGLEYRTFADGTTVVSGFGTCKDTDLVVPAVNEYGQTVTGFGIDNHTDSRLSSVRSLTIPDGCVSIPLAEFNLFTNLESLTIATTSMKYSLEPLFYASSQNGGYPSTFTTLSIVGPSIPDGVTLSGCDTLTTVTLDERITKIPANFFKNCVKLSKIEFSPSVTSIGKFSFYNTAITSFTLPERVTGIPESAFENCKKLVNFTFNDSVRTIGFRAFSGCAKLASLDLPGSLTLLNEESFAGCSSLRSVEIPQKIASLPRYLFSGCSSLSSVTLPARVTKLNYQAFAGTAIRSFTYPATVTEDDGAFAGCKALTEIHYHDKMTKIGSLAGCSGLTSVVIPNGIKELPINLFDGCTKLVEFVFPEGITQIPAYCFARCSSLTEIVVPDTVTEIGELAFYQCAKLRKVVLPEGITRLERDVFSESPVLSEVNLPSTLTEIAMRAFRDCKGLTSIVLPSSLTSIGEWAFMGSGLTSLTLDCRAAIYHHAFANCASLKSIDIGGHPSFAEQVFENCSALETVILREGVTAISREMFAGCPLISELNFPSTLAYIGDDAFSSCTLLTSLTLPASMTTMTRSALRGCTSISTLTILASGLEVNTQSIPLTTLIIGEGVEVIAPGLCKDNTLLTSVTLPESLRVISEKAFYGCTGLTEITFPSSLETVGDEAFRKSGLTSVSFTSPTLTIGNSAFRECTSVSAASFADGAVTTTGYAFYGCTALTDLSGTAGLAVRDRTDFPARFETVVSGMHFFGTTLLYVENDFIDSIVEIPDNVTMIATGAFRDCTVFREVHFPAGLKTISPSAFQGCTRLQRVTLPAGLTSLGESAFEGCTALTEIVFPDQLEAIPSRVVYGCDQLTTVTLGSAIREIASDVYFALNYYQNTGLTKRTFYIVNYPGTAEEWSAVLTNGSFFESCTIVCTDRRIAQPVFSGSATNGTYVIDSDLTMTLTGNNKGLYEQDLFGITNKTQKVRRLVISEGVTELIFKSSVVFTSLEEVIFPSTLVSFPINSFTNTPWYQNGTFYDENGLFILNGSLIRAHTDLVGVLELPAGLTYIGTNAFASCRDLTEVRIPSGVTGIGESAFSGCSALAYVNFPEGLISIGRNAFSGCKALNGVVLPSTLRKMGDSPFSLCDSLEELTIPAGVREFSLIASHCPNLKTLIVNAPVKESDRVVWYCSALEVVIVGEGSTALGESAIYDCSALRAIVIPATVTKVDCISLSTGLYFRSASNLETVKTAISKLFRLGGKMVNTYLYSETQPASAGYWHFDENGLPVLWD